MLLGRSPKDFDVATSAHPDEVLDLFRNSRAVGRRFRMLDTGLDDPGSGSPDDPVAAVWPEEHITDLTSQPSLPELPLIALPSWVPSLCQTVIFE